MDPATRAQFAAHVVATAEEVLQDGARAYLRKLSRADCLQALMQEPYCLGLCSHGDTDSSTHLPSPPSPAA
jgi:hypothetical protein